MTNHLHTNLSWRKSTHSENNTACVEVADPGNARTAVRDSKDKDPNAPVLMFPDASWGAFVQAVARGDFGDV